MTRNVEAEMTVLPAAGNGDSRSLLAATAAA